MKKLRIPVHTFTTKIILTYAFVMIMLLLKSSTILLPAGAIEKHTDVVSSANTIKERTSINKAFLIRNSSIITSKLPISRHSTTPIKTSFLLTSVPLSAQLQQQIYTEVCHKDRVRFCLLMAVAKKESLFQADLIGDEGQSYGIVQIMFKWHLDRLDKFGYTTDDLFDPTNCMTVGLDYLEDLAGYPDDLQVTHKILMKYNMGPSKATSLIEEGHTSSGYSREVMASYEEYLHEFARNDAMRKMHEINTIITHLLRP